MRLNNRNTVVVIGVLYQQLARFLHRPCEETVQLLLKILKNGDSQMRCEILLTFEHIINGLGLASRFVHREIDKVAKIHLCDRSMSVRSAAAMVMFSSNNKKKRITRFFSSHYSSVSLL